MNGREYFHESVVRDVVDILTSLKDYDEVQFLQNSSNHRSFKSITSATKDLILTFPVLVSSDADVDSACMIAKAHEKKCASLLHMLFTAICVGSNEDVFDYVKKFHRNVGSMNGTLEDYADSLDQIAATLDENYEFKGKIDQNVLNIVLQELKESNYTLPDDVKEVGIDEYKIIPASVTGYKDRVICEAKYSDDQKDSYRKGFKKGKDWADNTISNLNDQIVGLKNDNKKLKGKVKLYGPAWKAKEHERLSKVLVKNNGNGAGNGGGSYVNYEDELDKAKRLESLHKMHDTTFLNNEYKKANELQPTLMVVNFIQKGENGAPSMATTAVIGVKAKVYPVSSIDICNRITSKLEDKNVLNSFIRATTNEIGFFRDFLFAIDKAKIDAMSYGRSASSNKLWKVLERRSTKSKFRRALKMSNDATAITTLVLTENDVEYMKKNKGIDIMNVSFARKLLDAYNFMCICVINEATEVASFLYDTGDDNYERLTFTNLEREASDNSYKKMVNLLTKMNR